MTIHVSLPAELEARVHSEVATGLYSSASEVVREALRNFFSPSFTPEEIAWLKTEMRERVAELERGEYEPRTVDEFFNEIDRQLMEKNV